MSKLNVLFMQSEEYFVADSMIHTLLMRYLDREVVNVHIASNHGREGARPAIYHVLNTIEDAAHRDTRFGPSITNMSRLAAVSETVKSAGGVALSLAGLAAYCRRNNIDIVHCKDSPRDAFWGLLVAKAAGARCIIHVHVKAEPWIRPQVRWAMRQADALVGVSEFVADSLVAMGYCRDKTHWVLNGLDLTRWNSQDDGALDEMGWSDHSDGEVRSEFGIASDVPVLACLSRLIPWKGHRELIRALAVVKRSVPDFRLLLVGSTMEGHEVYAEELRQLTQELELGESIIFAGYRRDVPRIMAASDIYAMPSFEEPFGMVYLEAMAMRKPVIALDNGGPREIVEHQKSGLLSKPEDIDHLAANIVELIGNPELCRKMGLYGRRRVEDYFTPQRMAQDMQLIYEKLVPRARDRQ